MGALTKSKEFEIRMRYELGEDLNKLAVIYKVPLTTLNKRKKLAEIKGDAWIKGARSKSAYKQFVENDEATCREMREMINNEAREEIIMLKEAVKEVYKKPNAELFEGKIEKAVMARTKRIEKFLELRRNIEEIPTPKEEQEIRKIKLDIELKRRELEDKSLEIKLKKAEVDMLLGGSKEK
ncbi:hypothetical protein [Fusobacterium varium]|uniref:hypothetical protein n=1 Tax=Fusobacterium varium TaxID=856 RepID=UPI0022E72D34|nr:hypothetical protein [Fusobacterium varium]